MPRHQNSDPAKGYPKSNQSFHDVVLAGPLGTLVGEAQVQETAAALASVVLIEGPQEGRPAGIR
jgi:hypothetical protein